MTTRSVLLLLVLLAPALVGAVAPPVLEVTDPSGVAVSGDYIEVLQDPSGDLGLAAVTSSPLGDHFQRVQQQTPNLGMSQDWIWFRFRVANQTSAPLLLELREARIAFVEWWLVGPDGAIQAHALGGRFRKGEGQRREHRFDRFELPLSQGEQATVYLRVRSYANVNLDLRLAGRAAIEFGIRASYLLLGLFYGALAIMLGYNALLFFDLREPAYIWLSLLIGGALLWRADFDGLLTTLIPGLWPIDWWGMVIGSCTALGSILLFDDAFLDLRRHAPRLSRLFRFSAVATFAVPLLHTVDPGLEVKASMVAALLICTGSIALGIWSMKRQPGSAARFLFAWATLLVSITLLMLVNFGILPALPVLKNLPYIGILLLLLFLSLAQAARVSALRQAAEAASRALRRNESRLEQLVEERTTELAQERDRADAANRAKSQFLANMSHELRTPLNSVLGYSELLAQRNYPEPEREFIASIRGSGRILLQLINDILDLSRIEAGGMVLKPEPTNLRSLIAELRQMFQQTARNKGLELRATLVGTPPGAVMIDSLRVRQVLINLLGNAIKFTERGEIGLTLHCTPTPDGASVQLRFEVTDTGRGIPPEEHRSIFEMFTQRLGQDQARFGGTGLGLAISRRLATLMEGELTLDSELGRGSRFALLLPHVVVASDASPSGSESIDARIRFAPSRVLVADDNAANRGLLAVMLESVGLRVQLVEDGQALLDAVAAARPDLILTDLVMPVMDGLTAIRKLRDDPGTADIPIVMVTASASAETEAEVRPLCDGYLTKPIERELLLEALRGFLPATLSDSVTDPTERVQPEDDSGPTRSNSARSHQADRSAPRLLVVEDNELNQALAKALLVRQGFEVVIAHNGRQALDCLEQARFDGILMDIQMPEMDGYEVTRAIREQERYRELPIIAMSASLMSDELERVRQAGMNDYIAKPIDRSQMSQVLARWIKTNRAEEAPAVPTPEKPGPNGPGIFQSNTKVSGASPRQKPED